jgi:hypothetical protein
MVAEVTRRAPDGTWSAQPDIVEADAELRLERIGFAALLREVSKNGVVRDSAWRLASSGKGGGGWPTLSRRSRR